VSWSGWLWMVSIVERQKQSVVHRYVTHTWLCIFRVHQEGHAVFMPATSPGTRPHFWETHLISSVGCYWKIPSVKQNGSSRKKPEPRLGLGEAQNHQLTPWSSCWESWGHLGSPLSIFILLGLQSEPYCQWKI
jgi:hypothetical protein